MAFRIPKFIIIPTGQYNPPVHTSYSVSGQDGNAIKRMTQELTNNGNNIAPAAVTQLASQILVPSTASGEVYIPNSFSDKRFRFMMEVIHDNGSVQYLAGYTDKLDAINGNIAPDTQLYFNMSYTVRRNNITGPNGHNTVSNTIVDASQILTAPDMPVTQAYGGISQAESGTAAVSMRPSDVFSISEAATAAAALEERSQRQDGSRLNLSRTTSLAAELRTGFRKSRISNNLSSRFLSDSLGAYMEAEGSADTGNSFFSKWDQATATLCEPTATSDAFFSPVTQLGNQLANGGCVAWGSLTAIVPEVIEQARNSISHSLKLQTLDGRNGEYMASNTKEAMACIKILNGLPAIMASNFVTRASLTARSGIPTTSGHVVDGPMAASNPNSITEVTSYSSFGSNAVSATVGKNIARAFMHEILADISRQFHFDVTVIVTLDTLGDTEVSIAFGNDHPTTFYNPTFCNALYPPTLSLDSSSLSSLAVDLSHVFGGVSRSTW